MQQLQRALTLVVSILLASCAAGADQRGTSDRDARNARDGDDVNNSPDDGWGEGEDDGGYDGGYDDDWE